MFVEKEGMYTLLTPSQESLVKKKNLLGYKLYIYIFDILFDIFITIPLFIEGGGLYTLLTPFQESLVKKKNLLGEV